MRPSHLLLLTAALAARAGATPTVLHQSGFLLGPTDAPVTASGVALGFSIWSAPTGGTQLWPASGESTCTVEVRDGYYAVTLDGAAPSGCGAGLTAELLAGAATPALRVTVDGVELSPRLGLGRAPHAALADGLTATLGLAGGGTGATNAADARANLGAAAAGANTDITSLGGLTTPLSLAQGGTGGASATAARASLGAAAAGANTDISSLGGLTTPLTVAQGGTGANTLAQHAVLLGGGAGPVATVAGAGTAGDVLTSNGASAAPSWKSANTVVTKSGIDGALDAGGAHNVLVGSGTGANATSAANNTALGFEAGFNLATGAYNTHLGYRAGYPATSLNGTVAIGADSGGSGAAPAADNDFVLGTENHNVKVPGTLRVGPAAAPTVTIASGRLGVGTSAPAATVEIHNASESGYLTTLADVATKSAFKIRPHASNTTSFHFGQGNSGNAHVIQAANGPGTGAYELALNPFGGNVGIGTLAPTRPLDVVTSGSSGARLKSTGGFVDLTLESTAASYAGQISFLDSDNNANGDGVGGRRVALIEAVRVAGSSGQDGSHLYFYTHTANGSLNAPLRLGHDGKTTVYRAVPNDYDDNALHVATNNGYATFGALNASWFHMHTDRPRFYFNKPAEASGGFATYSTRDVKQDIVPVSAREEQKVLDEVARLPMYRFRYKGKDLDEKVHLGVIAEEAPKQILTPSGKAVDYYDYTSFALAAIKAQQREIAEQRKLLDEQRRELEALRRAIGTKRE